MCPSLFFGPLPAHRSLDVVTTLLKGKARRDVNKTTRGLRQTPLYCAVKHGYGDIALSLVRAGADVDSADGDGWSPLMRATADGRAELVNNLLLSGAFANFRNKKGDRPLHYAVQHGHLDVIKVLLKAGASPGCRRKVDDMSAVDLAAERGDTGALKELLAAGPNAEALDDGGLSALSIAARGGRAGAIDALVDAGADPDDPNDDADTPLHLACLYLQPDSVRALLRRNADETMCNDEFDAPEDIVGHYVPEERRDEEVVEWIREMLARAPADRVWRRRGWLAMLSARRRRAVEQEQLQMQERRLVVGDGGRAEEEEEEVEEVVVFDGGCTSEGSEVPLSSPAVSRRKLSIGASVEAGDDSSAHVHPSLKSFHWTVTKMVDVTDELVFRRIVSYL